MHQCVALSANSNLTGSQRLQCPNRVAASTYPTLFPPDYAVRTRDAVLQLYLDCYSCRCIGRVLAVNHQAVANWFNAYHTVVPPGGGTSLETHRR